MWVAVSPATQNVAGFVLLYPSCIRKCIRKCQKYPENGYDVLFGSRYRVRGRTMLLKGGQSLGRPRRGGPLQAAARLIMLEIWGYIAIQQS